MLYCQHCGGTQPVAALDTATRSVNRHWNGIQMRVSASELHPVGCVVDSSLILFFFPEIFRSLANCFSGLLHTGVNILRRPGSRRQSRHTVLGKHISSACFFQHFLVTLIGSGSISSNLSYLSKWRILHGSFRFEMPHLIKAVVFSFGWFLNFAVWAVEQVSVFLDLRQFARTGFGTMWFFCGIYRCVIRPLNLENSSAGKWKITCKINYFLRSFICSHSFFG